MNLPTKSYSHLIKSIQTQVFEARHKIERTAVSMYWYVGKAIEDFIISNGSSELDGENIYKKVSVDIGIDIRTLNQAVVFYRSYPKINLSLPLSWSHYRYLSMVPSLSKRKLLEKKIVKEHLSVHQLQSVLKEERSAIKTIGSSKKLVVARGELFHYRIVKVESIGREEGGMFVDCGFNNTVRPDAKQSLKNKYVYKSFKTNDGYGFKPTNVRVKNIYIYVAQVKRIVDADTLIVHIDCGFGIFHTQRIRLKGIDAPEKKTLAGQKSLREVEKILSACPFVIVKTEKTDKYGRYLADVFYLKGEKNPQVTVAKGHYLNQLLIDQGLAEIY
ncbi:hypothetical protein MNBD_BACTEROID05-544 [hydrothermal vent metagenome]|uniref:TNase-like domain-containing protein n=1 Tax=hydrothermal vent metagenome TaxID=652676 RepID=A0A3B0TWD4_9ZZZZ